MEDEAKKMSRQTHRSTPETPVREFHEAFGLPAPQHPSQPDTELVRLRMRLIREEFEEVMEELTWFSRNMSDPDVRASAEWRQVAWEVLNEKHRRLLKELSDLRYVVEGTAVAFGLDISGAYMEVHRSNMSKLGEDGKPVLREDGKVLKGPNYFEADMSKFVPDIIDVEVVDE